MTDSRNPNYSAPARLAEVKLRLENVGTPAVGALLVEGTDDRRLFLPFAVDPRLIIPCAGRARLLAVTDIMSPTDQESIAVLTDCDYEVIRDNLHPSLNMVITGQADVEADMLTLGLLGRIIQHVIPHDLPEPGDLARIAADVLDHATTLAVPLGRARMAAQPYGVSLDELKDFAFSKHVLADGRPNEEKIVRTVWLKISDVVGEDEFRSQVSATPRAPYMCKGHDLISAVAFVLRKYHRAKSNLDAKALELALRTAMADREVFENWPVVKYIRRWEQAHGHMILKSES